MNSDPIQDAMTIAKAIERAKSELERMIDLNPQGMMLVKRDATVVRANRALLELLGRTAFPDVLGQSLSVLFPETTPGFFDRLLSGQSGYESLEIQRLLQGERSQSLLFTAVNSDASTDSTVLIVEDVTGEKEQALHAEKKHKKEAIQAVVGALQHRINQPLTVILIRAHLMQLSMQKLDPNNEELHTHIESIVSLTTQIADTLRLLEVPKDFVTEPYSDGVDILDIRRSGGRVAKWKSICTHALDAMISLLERHEPGAAAHSMRTAEYATQLARKMNLDDEHVEIVRTSAAYHDLGKIGIPDAILQKPGPLTASEREEVCRHPEIGYNLLRRFPLLATEAEAVYAHHEHFDGKGYPRGLAGDNIPIAARIIAVADAFDALRYERYYHDAEPLENTVKEIRSSAGTHFDPSIVEIFYANYREMDLSFSHNKR